MTLLDLVMRKVKNGELNSEWLEGVKWKIEQTKQFGGFPSPPIRPEERMMWKFDFAKGVEAVEAVVQELINAYFPIPDSKGYMSAKFRNDDWQ
jgi:hypothetical protein